MAAIQMDQKEFQQAMAQGKTLLVDYWAPWCGYCRRIASAYEKIAQQYASRLTVAKVNIDQEVQLAQEQQIEVIPTLVLYRDGKALASITAPDSKAAIDAFLHQHLEGSL